MRAPCVRCGHLLHTGEGRIVSFTVDELEQMVADTTDQNVARRLICAIGLLDKDLEQHLLGKCHRRNDNTTGD
jgi:hypothetical protein